MTKNHPHPVDIAVDALAVHRIVRLLQVDEVPPMPQLRKAFLDRYATTKAGELADCPWCLSIWVGVLVAIARRVSPRLWTVLAFVLASSGVTGLISTWLVNQEPEQQIELVRDIAITPDGRPYLRHPSDDVTNEL